MYQAVEGPSTRPIVLSKITGSYCRGRRHFKNYFRPQREEIRSTFDSL